MNDTAAQPDDIVWWSVRLHLRSDSPVAAATTTTEKGAVAHFEIARRFCEALVWGLASQQWGRRAQGDDSGGETQLQQRLGSSRPRVFTSSRP